MKEDLKTLVERREAVIAHIQALHRKEQMGPKEWQELKVNLNMSNPQLAKLLGTHYLTIQRFSSGARYAGRQMALLARLINQL